MIKVICHLVYQVKDNGLQQFTARIKDTVATERHDMLLHLWADVEYRLDICLPPGHECPP